MEMFKVSLSSYDDDSYYFQNPFLSRKLSEIFNLQGASELEGVWYTFSTKTLQTQIKNHFTEIFQRSAIVGKVAPKLKLVEIKSEKVMKLLNLGDL